MACYPDAENAPIPKVATVPFTVFKHVSHATCPDTRRSVTTVESSTYGSELVSMRIANENLLGSSLQTMYDGDGLEKHSTLLGDDNSVIVNTQLHVPSSSIKKKHNSVVFHKAREAVAAGFVRTGHALRILLILRRPHQQTSIGLQGLFSTKIQHEGSYEMIVYTLCVIVTQNFDTNCQLHTYIQLMKYQNSYIKHLLQTQRNTHMRVTWERYRRRDVLTFLF